MGSLFLKKWWQKNSQQHDLNEQIVAILSRVPDDETFLFLEDVLGKIKTDLTRRQIEAVLIDMGLKKIIERSGGGCGDIIRLKPKKRKNREKKSAQADLLKKI